MIRLFFLNFAPYLIWGIFSLHAFNADAQRPFKQFEPDNFDSTYYNQFSSNKIIPKEISKQVLIALSYFPELKNTPIEFKFSKKHSPLATAPTFVSCFKSESKRKFIVTISNNTSPKLTPILFYNLPYNAQIGVIGHELSHVSDLSKKNFLALMRIGAGHLSKKFMDNFENNTDMICIKHGLGYQLMDWSKYVRTVLKIDEWYGADNPESFMAQGKKRERYMSPPVIQSYINQMPLYR
ncbi:MAG: hypothetical protein ABI723_07830 [Bacteroidia bacterium]